MRRNNKQKPRVAGPQDRGFIICNGKECEDNTPELRLLICPSVPQADEELNRVELSTSEFSGIIFKFPNKVGEEWFRVNNRSKKAAPFRGDE